MSIKKNTAINFKNKREKKGYSCKDLANEFGLHCSTIYRWERGNAKIPNYAFLALKHLPNKGKNDKEGPIDKEIVKLKTRYFPTAIDYYNAALAVSNYDNDSIPAYNLIGHSIETSLKTFLKIGGKTEANLRNFNHDLSTMLKISTSMGLNISEKFKKNIFALNEYYEKDQKLRYYKGREYTLMPLNDLFTGTFELIKQITKLINR